MSIDSGCKVLVTGASGLIGSHLVQALSEAGYEPRAFSRGELAPGTGAVEEVRGDVRDLDALRSALRGCDAVVHAAAVYSYARSRAAEMMSTNVNGTRNVLEAAARERVGRVLLTSSSATCGPVAGRAANELDEAPAWELAVPYKRSKLSAERLALERVSAGQDVVVVNPTTTIGALDRKPTPSGRMVRDVLQRRIRGYIASGGLNVVAADDVARGHVQALQRGRCGERYLLGGDNLSMPELFALIARLGGVPAPRLPVPYPLALASALAAHAFMRPFGRELSLLTLDEVRLSRLPMYFSSEKAKAELGYRPRGAEEALQPAVEWFSRAMPMETRRSSAGGGRRALPAGRPGVR